MGDASPAVSGMRKLRPRARLMQTLGSELISSASVALAELVKNAFDADARHVLVRLSEEQGGASLDVLDDGLGMSPTVVETTWLEPATPNRRRYSVSPGGRRVLGEKGVGRFATAKLARHLTLGTRQPEVDVETTATVDWTQFENDELFLEQVEVPIDHHAPDLFAKGGAVSTIWASALSDLGIVNATPAVERGTLLQMSSLREEWSESFVLELRRSLQRLVSPFADKALADSALDFRVFLQLPGRLSELQGAIGPAEELTRPHYTLEATVDDRGMAEVSMTLRGSAEPVRESLNLATNAHRHPRMGAFRLSLRVFDRDPRSLSELAAGGARISDVRQQIDAVAGISIYRDGFRVLPYGQPGNDWLHLDQRRINTPSKRISNSQVIGFVSISREGNPGLVDQSNREGLVSGPAFEDLKSSVVTLIGALETHRAELRREERIRARDLFERDALRRLDEAVARRPNDNELARLVGKARRDIESRDAVLRDILSQLQRQATVAMLIDGFVHEATQPIRAVLNASRVGITLAKVAGTDGPMSASDAMREFRLIQGQARALNDLLNLYRPFGGRKQGRPHPVEVEAVVRDTVAILRPEIDRVQADVTLPDGHTSVTVDQTELQQVVINLLINSLYWLGTVPDGLPRLVSIAVARREDQSVTLQVSDSGPGVPDSIRDRIFEPYFSGRADGHGLGLWIASEIVSDYYGGDLRLVDDGPLPGATFEATLRRRVDPL